MLRVPVGHRCLLTFDTDSSVSLASALRVAVAAESRVTDKEHSLPSTEQRHRFTLLRFDESV
jgi:hypothetical protein